MTAAYAPPPRGNLTPAFVAAVALHVGVFAALILFASRPGVIPTGSAVPINIVSSAPATDSRPAVAAPEPQAAAVETPVPQAPPPIPAAAPPPPAPAPPTPAPTKAKPAPAPKPTPAPAKAKPTARPAPAKAAAAVAKPQPARPAFDLDALQASIARAARSAPSKPAFAARRGPTRAETAPQARIDAGAGVSQSSMQGLQQLLQRLWNPNCNVEGGGAVIVPVRFGIGDDGRVVGRVTAGGQDGAPVVAAAARRAIDAVHEAEPYGPEYRGASFKVIFDARKACAQ